MKHPQHEEWIPFLCGEASVEAAARLSEHLRDCAECSEQIEGWERTLEKLDTWQAPKFPSQRRKRLPVLKWAAAAAILVGIGFGMGRFVPSASAEMNQLRAELADSIKESLAVDLRREVREQVDAETRAALAVMNETLTNKFEGQFTAVINRAATDAVNTSERETRRQVTELIKVLQRNRDQDRQKTLTLVKELRTQRDKDYFGLRKDLETLASMTDDEFKEARQKFVQLVSNTNTRDDGKN